MDTLRQFLKPIVDACGPWGSFASVLGLLVSVVGFIITIKSVVTAKKASQQAERAARQATEKVLRQGTLANFSSSIEVMEQIITIMVPYMNRVESTKLPGYLFQNTKSGVYSAYFGGIQKLWTEAEPIETFLQGHPEFKETSGTKAP
jgi:Na+-translocating ferredoxin:NAD+ oxidoreductase RnfG subunit